MDDAMDVRRAAPGKFARHQKYKEWGLYGLIFVLFLSIIALLALAMRLEAKATQVSEGIYRSESEMVNGGKRFIDAFYSLNAATVEHDQFKAISMMATPELREKRLDYLTRTDLVREVRNKSIASRVDWKNAKAEVQQVSDGVHTVEYQARLVLNNKDAYPLNIVLELIPTEKSDENTDGVGVVSWTDVAENPFIEGPKS